MRVLQLEIFVHQRRTQCMRTRAWATCRSVLSMLSRSPEERPTLDELLDKWAPIAQMVGDGAESEFF